MCDVKLVSMVEMIAGDFSSGGEFSLMAAGGLAASQCQNTPAAQCSSISYDTLPAGAAALLRPAPAPTPTPTPTPTEVLSGTIRMTVNNPREFQSRPESREVVKVSIASILHLDESLVHIDQLTFNAPGVALISQPRLLQDEASEAETGEISVEYTIDGPNLDVIQETIIGDEFSHGLADEIDAQLVERNLPQVHANVLETSGVVATTDAASAGDANDPDNSEGSSSNMGMIVGGGLVAVLVIGGVVFFSGVCTQEKKDEEYGMEMGRRT